MKLVYETPYEFLAEIEAYLSFRLLGDPPSVPEEDMKKIRSDIAAYLENEGGSVHE